MAKSKTTSKPPANVERLKHLPSVDELLKTGEAERWTREFSRAETVAVLRDAVADTRGAALKGALDANADLTRATLDSARAKLDRRGRLRIQKVVNASGVILHTGLGRAMLPKAAMDRLQELNGYTNLELDVERNERNYREGYVADLVCKLTGAESATVVNNNAAACVLIINTFAHNKATIVSRGELVEIGGSFRMPEVMEQSNSKLVEVGSTNKTRPSDYERAITPETGLLLKVHTSNFRVVGFTQSVGIKDLVALGKKHKLPVVDDLGSGALYDPAAFGLDGEPLVKDSVAAGADAVCFSGDKLLGGPQAGIICGKKDAVHKIRSNPLFRALRVGKMTLAALEATLQLHLHPETLARELPTLRMFSTPVEELEARGRKILKQLAPSRAFDVALADAETEIGSGSLPTRQLPTKVLKLTLKSGSADELAKRLRTHRPPVVPRIADGAVCLDLRTIQPDEDAVVVAALKSVT